MKKVLIISYYWPPSGGPGVQRVLNFCKHLPKFEWEPIVLTVKDGEFPVNDFSLKPSVPNSNIYYSKSISFHKIFNLLSRQKSTPAYQLNPSKNESILTRFSRWVRLNIVLPDGRIGWYKDSVKVGSQIINSNDIEVILTTAPPYTTHLIGMTLSKKYNIPWAADFRDPWTDYHYYENKRMWITNRIDKYLEQKVINSAQALITVTKTMAKNFNRDFNVIYNGYNEEDYGLIKNNKKNNKIIISHLGTMSNKQNPSNFFDAVHHLNKTKNKYKIDLIGSVHPDIKNTVKKKKYDYFINFLDYVNHDKAIKIMCQSDFLLLVINNAKKNRGLINAKLFEYIRSGSKIILIGPEGGDAERIINETNSGFCFGYNESSAYKNILTKNHKIQPVNYKKYSRENLTKELADILKNIGI